MTTWEVKTYLTFPFNLNASTSSLFTPKGFLGKEKAWICRSLFHKKKFTQGLGFVHSLHVLDFFSSHSQLEVADIEQLVTMGRQMKACPYYGARNAVPLAEVIKAQPKLWTHWYVSQHSVKLWEEHENPFIGSVKIFLIRHNNVALKWLFCRVFLSRVEKGIMVSYGEWWNFWKHFMLIEHTMIKLFFFFLTPCPGGGITLQHTPSQKD